MWENTDSSTPANTFWKAHVFAIVKTCVFFGILLDREFKVIRRQKARIRRFGGMGKRVEKLLFSKARAVNIFAPWNVITIKLRDQNEKKP